MRFIVLAAVSVALAPGCTQDTAVDDCPAGSEGCGGPGGETGAGGSGSGGTGASSSGRTWAGDTPGECRADELASTVTGSVSFTCSATMAAAASSVPVSFDSSGELRSIAGASCTFHPFEPLPDPPGCEQYFDCAGCLYFIRNWSGTWQVVATEDGCPTEKYCHYDLGEYDPSVSTGGTGGSGGTSGCAPCSRGTCYDGCSSECDGYPGSCVAMCLKGCDACCSP